jgi:protein-disulfide isomerase
VWRFHTDVESGEPEVDMARFDDQPWEGPADAAVRVVVVGDFECSQCRAVAHVLDALREEWPGRLRTCFVNAPLGAACNAALAVDLHPHACALAERGECAAEQGRFAELHRLLFDELAPGDARPAAVDARLDELGLDRAAFEACLASGRGAAAVAADLELCRELELTTTPSLVVNGYPLRGSAHPWMLRALLEPLLAGQVEAR